jgi:hypothetical protein
MKPIELAQSLNLNFHKQLEWVQKIHHNIEETGKEFQKYLDIETEKLESEGESK